MLYIIISLLGCLFGFILARYTKEELRKGVFYFRLLEILIILILILVILLSSDFNLLLFIMGILIGLMLRFEYLYFGFVLVFPFSNDVLFLLSALIFIYGLPYGSLIYYNKKIKYLIWSVILFFIPFVNYFFDYNLISFATGGLFVFFIAKIRSLLL